MPSKGRKPYNMKGYKAAAKKKPSARKAAAPKKAAARKAPARKAPAKKTATRKAPARRTAKRASNATANRSNDNYSFSYYPGQSSNRDIPVRAYENRDNRTGNVTTYNTPRTPYVYATPYTPVDQSGRAENQNRYNRFMYGFTPDQRTHVMREQGVPGLNKRRGPRRKKK